MFDTIVNLRTLVLHTKHILRNCIIYCLKDLFCHIMRPPGEWALKFLNYFCTLLKDHVGISIIHYLFIIIKSSVSVSLLDSSVKKMLALLEVELKKIKEKEKKIYAGMFDRHSQKE